MKKDSLHKTRWRGHAFGTCLVRHEDKLVYVNIPKNATEWAKYTIGGEKHNFIDKPLPDDYRYLVILRDPRKRLVSGICEWLKRYTQIQPNNPIFDNPDVLSLLVGPGGAHDEHTELQARFIEGIPLERTTFFKCDETLKETVEHWFEENKPLTHKPTSPTHHTHGDWKELLDKLNHIIDTKGQILRRIREQLKIDYDLYNSVQYYTKGDK